jgi:hypothetical protein
MADAPFGSLAPDAYVARLFHIESGGNPNAVTGSNRGLGQFGPQEEARYGITAANRTDPEVQAAAVRREAQEHAATLRAALGRDPTAGELYLAHQQGVAGAPALLSADPNMPAWQAVRKYYPSDAIAKKAITGNIPSTHPLYGQDADAVTAGNFTKLWIDKFERGGGGGASPTRFAAAGGGVPAASSSPGGLGIAGAAAAPSPESETPSELATLALLAQAKDMTASAPVEPLQPQVLPPLPTMGQLAPVAPAPLAPIRMAMPAALRGRLVAAMKSNPIGGSA